MMQGTEAYIGSTCKELLTHWIPFNWYRELGIAVSFVMHKNRFGCFWIKIVLNLAGNLGQNCRGAALRSFLRFLSFFFLFKFRRRFDVLHANAHHKEWVYVLLENSRGENELHHLRNDGQSQSCCIQNESNQALPYKTGDVLTWVL